MISNKVDESLQRNTDEIMISFRNLSLYHILKLLLRGIWNE